MHFPLKTFSFLMLLPFLSACAIQKNVQSVQNAPDIKLVCIQDQPNTHMQAYQPMLQRLIEQRGIQTEIYRGTLPEHCRYNIDYVAKWSWDAAMYLRYNRINVYDGRKPIGSAEYKAGIMSLAKWGQTETKVAPMIAQLFP